ncbi:hypothetical protein GCM10009733_053310 [Nonomuraea maheshkhaliensis]|uniref:Secreted protein n=1 Tax=Nonomuraea maheshkhaliensis TaxID=419590 RepID=A0ABN2FJK3_9ACTN
MTPLRRRIAGALLVAAAACSALSIPAAQASTTARHQARADPCWAEPTHRIGGGLIKYEQFGARSLCKPQTWMHWHQVHLECADGGGPAYHGNMTGGTGVSEAWCPKNTFRTNFWVTQGPDHP